MIHHVKGPSILVLNKIISLDPENPLINRGGRTLRCHCQDSVEDGPGMQL